MDVGTRYLIEARVDKVGKKKERLHKIGKRRRQRINGGKGLIMDVDMGYIKTKRYIQQGKYEAYQPVLPKSRSMRTDRLSIGFEADERTKVEKKKAN